MPEEEKTGAMTDGENAATTGAKKKRNRKKKKKKSSEGDTPGAVSTSTQLQQQQQQQQQASQLNPHVILRQRLVSQGFSEGQIDQAMEEMWNKDLAYDEYDSVLKFLKGEKDGEKEKAENATNEKKNGAGPQRSSLAEEEGSSSAGNGAEESKEVEGEDQESTKQKPFVATKPIPKPGVPITKEQKLEMVAGFENMTDAIFAFTEWVSKAAKPRDLEDLCATTNTLALVTIFRRSITECKDQSLFDKDVLPAMNRLMAALLGKSGISQQAVEETRSAFETLLKKARLIVLMEQPDARDFAERVSRFIVSRISLAIGESNSASINSSNNTATAKPGMPALPASMSAHSAGDPAIVDLLSKREIHMTAAKRYGVLARSACATLVSQDATLASATSRNDGTLETEIGKADIMLALVGEDTKTAFESQMTRLEELKVQAQEGVTESATELQTTIEELSSEREAIQQRVYELKQSIEKLETYDAELCVKLNDTQASLESEAVQACVEASNLNVQIEEASKSIKYGTAVAGLAEMLKKYDDSLDQAIQASAQAASTPDVDPVALASKHMQVFVSRACNYFASEANTVDFLRKRIETSEKEVAELHADVIELQGLGLDTTIRQMKLDAKAIEALIEKDSGLMERFTAEATTMFENFVCRLEEYEATGVSNKLAPIHGGTIGKIPASLATLGTAHAGRLDPFLTDVPTMALNGHNSHTTTTCSSSSGSSFDMSPQATDPLGTPKSNSEVAPIGTPKTGGKKTMDQAPPPSSPTMVPKFTWAAAKPAAEATAPKTSLLDIQKEELNSKATTD